MEEQLIHWQQEATSLHVSRISFDFAISLDLTRDKTSFLLRIESPFTIRDKNGNETIYSPPAYNNPAPIVALLHQTITSTSIAKATGKLTALFSNDSALFVFADNRYEAWELAGNDGLRIICLPGGGLSIWKAAP